MKCTNHWYMINYAAFIEGGWEFYCSDHTFAFKFHLPTVYSNDGSEFISQKAEFTTIFVLEEFEGELFKSLHRAGQRILGPTTVMQYAEKERPLPNNIRPLYTISMKNLVITFSGFREKEEVSSMVALVHHMGGTIRKDLNIKRTTHLVASANAISGEKYKYAVSLGIPVMSSEWVFQTWARRHDAKCVATCEELMQYKLLPFVSCRIAFVGYDSSEEEHMVETSLKNGGEVVQPVDTTCTHIVIADGHSITPSDYCETAHLVKNEWFWACIQIEAKAEESIYAFENVPSLKRTGIGIISGYSSPSMDECRFSYSPGAVSSSSSFIMPIRGNKRKRLESVAHQLAMESYRENDYFCMDTDIRKKEFGSFSVLSDSYVDSTLSPDKSLDLSADFKTTDLSVLKSPPVDMRSLSPRHQVCFELFQTENNYVGILNTIMTVFKEPLEHPEQIGGPILAPAEIKIIFGNLPPIFEVHHKIRNELAQIIQCWNEDHSVGELILNHAPDFMKSYPPFVNFFEKTKEVLNVCDASKPRFHAFLKRCQSKPECGRQSLQELLIRPVQRLPSVILLLTDILKHTNKNNKDHEALGKAIQALKDVLMHINEDKRKTEGQVAMFDVVNDIENCPPNLLSSHRSLVCKVNVIEGTDFLTKKGCTISMFLFTDVLEICKKRSKRNNSIKSPGVASLSSGPVRPHSKAFKHLDLISLSHIKRVVDIIDTDEFKNYFAIVTWSSKELKELFYAFILLDDICKSTFLRTLCRQIANTVCKTDAENLLTSIEPHQISLQSADSTGNILTKALNKTRDKLGRVLSMRKTPMKRGLSRAVSTIISPLGHLGAPSNMHGLRLSSVTNLSQFQYFLPEVFFPFNSRRLKSFTSQREYESRSLSHHLTVYSHLPLEERR